MAAVLPSIPTGPSPPDPVRRSWDKSSLVSLLVTQSGLPIATGDGMAPLAPPPHVNASEKLAEADMQRMVLELFDIRSMWMMVRGARVVGRGGAGGAGRVGQWRKIGRASCRERVSSPV